MCSGGDDFVPRNRTGVKESLHRRLAKTPAPLMWPFLVVAPDPFIKIGLQGLDRSVELLAERDTIELVEDGLVKALDNAIRLWALRLGPRMVNVFHREIKLVVVMLGIAAIFRAAVGQHTAEPHLLFVEERQDAIVQEIGRCDWRLPIIEFGEGDLRVGVDEGLLIDASDALHVADVERVLGAAVTRMLTLEFAMGFLFGFGFFQRDELRLGEDQALLRECRPRPPSEKPKRSGIALSGVRKGSRNRGAKQSEMNEPPEDLENH